MPRVVSNSPSSCNSPPLDVNGNVIDLTNPGETLSLKNTRDFKLYYKILGDTENKVSLTGAFRSNIFDITAAEPVELKELQCEAQTKADDEGVMTGYIFGYSSDATLFEGRVYELVIPASAIRFNKTYYADYIDNNGFSLKIKGAMKPEEFILTNSNNLSLDEPTGKLYGLEFYTKENMKFVPGKQLTVKAVKNSDATDEQVVPQTLKFDLVQKPNSLYSKSVYAHFDINAEGEPLYLEKGFDYSFEIPAGVFEYIADSSIVTAQSTLQTKGATTESNKYGFTDASDMSIINIKVNGRHNFSTIYPIGVGYDFSFTPAENWKTESVKYNGEDITSALAAYGTYSVPTLPKQANFEVNLAYTEKITTADGESGVAELEASDVEVMGANGCIMISGLKGGEQVIVYDLGSSVVASQKAFDESLSLSLEPGIYLVRVNQETAKIRVL